MRIIMLPYPFKCIIFDECRIQDFVKIALLCTVDWMPLSVSSFFWRPLQVTGRLMLRTVVDHVCLSVTLVYYGQTVG